ncbi:GtrA family protein [Mycetocola miduiensis]|uniref:Putative flippase GtrA (Transmembrane translocase of bactoprenol-linked glucose) n=1 Tax=Mycetocola miduiensis TaxID=995034 RepID=A0A1I5DZB0_9MICO|nr:GtrA family protein [Mycetocola miduiensis]SFO04513.1 Putative flippase GtrA (transmembrane translocase of bactoprenol-linked glucose) [Mycetocola miduiensis]
MTAAAPPGRVRRLLVQVSQFGLVGAAGLLVDLTVFNALRLTLLAPENLDAGPLLAKAISTLLAIVTNWLGNRYWTFASDRRSDTAREGMEFFAVSLAGMGIGLGCLWVSHYVLGFTSVLADNISANVVGLALGAVFRFTLYRYWVFSPNRGASVVRPDAVPAGQNAAVAVPGEPA